MAELFTPEARRLLCAIVARSGLLNPERTAYEENLTRYALAYARERNASVASTRDILDAARDYDDLRTIEGTVGPVKV